MCIKKTGGQVCREAEGSEDREGLGDRDPVCRRLMAIVRPSAFFLNQVGFIIQIGGCLHRQGFGSTLRVTGSLGRSLSPEEPDQTSCL